MSGSSTVLRKESRENIRDRRTIFNSLLLGPILFPFMFIALIWFTTSAEEERAEKTLEVPVVGAEHGAQSDPLPGAAGHGHQGSTS